MKEGQLVSSVSIVSDQLIVTGQQFLNINGLTLSDPNTGFRKTFNVTSATDTQIVGTAVNFRKVPVPSLMNLIIDSAQGQTTYPVSFSLQNNAVTNPTIINGAITPLKFKGVTVNPSITSVLTYNPATDNFFFATPSGGGGGSSGVDAIAYGEGIVGDGSVATGTVDILVNVGVTGSTALTFIPYFNPQNKIVMDSSSATSTNFSGLQFKDLSGNFEIFNNNALRIQNGPNNDLMVLDYNGDLEVQGNILSNGNVVCTVGNCPGGSGITSVTATLPLVAVASGTTSVEISANTGTSPGDLVQLDGSGKLPAVDGSLLTNIPTMASATAANQIIISTGADKQLTTTMYPIQTAIGASGTVLKSDGTSATWQTDNGGTGDVVGPATATLNSVARYESGKVIKESGVIIDDAKNISGVNQLNGIAVNNFLTGTGLIGNLPIFGLLPSQLDDSGIALINIPIMASNATAQFQPILSGGNNKSQIAAPYTLPNTVCTSGQILKWDTAGFTCQSDLGGSGTGDVVGPGTSGTDTLAQFSDSTGKNIKGTAWTVPSNIGGLDQYLAVSGGQSLAWRSLPAGQVYVGGAPVVPNNLPKFGGSDGTQITDSGIVGANVATMVAAAASSNTIILSGGADKTLKSSGITIDDANNISGISLLNGKVANNLVTGSGLIGNLPVFGLLPNEIGDSAIPLTNIPTMASSATAQFQPILSDGINKSQIAAPYTFPSTTCLPGEVLKWNATGFDCQSDLGGTGSGLTEWKAGIDYKIGEIVNSGSDKNWLFKVIQDHTSVYAPGDVKAEKLLVISPPIITTGIQDGGEVTLAGNVATIASGTGFIAKYNTSPSPYPLITIVEWQEQTKTLPLTGIHTLYIDETGKLISEAGYSDSETSTNNISVALVDMNLGKAYDRKAYPTNPVGQLRSLSFFFGGMTKGLSYSATGLQLSRSAHENYFWGANTSDPHDPNTKQATATSPVTFYEHTQTGPIVPAAPITTLKSDKYDLNGTLVPMGNNKWGFIRIYTTLGVDDYVMYSQAEYQNESDAKNAAISTKFIKPMDLELTKFSSWLVFEKGDTNFSDNPITTCEPFGCDKFGSSAGGGGDVFGPSLAASNTVPIFAGTSGKILVASTFSPPAATGTVGQVLTSNGDGTTYWGNITGNPTATFLKSDKKLKKEIKNLPESYVDRLMELRPVSFVWRDNFNPDIGFIAQEVFKVFPDLVENNDDVLGINYSKLVVPLVKAFQEQNKKIQKDEQTIKMLLERIERLEKVIGEEAKK
jgi:hypothetical protein